MGHTSTANKEIPLFGWLPFFLCLWCRHAEQTFNLPSRNMIVTTAFRAAKKTIVPPTDLFLSTKIRAFSSWLKKYWDDKHSCPPELDGWYSIHFEFSCVEGWEWEFCTLWTQGELQLTSVFKTSSFYCMCAIPWTIIEENFKMEMEDSRSIRFTSGTAILAQGEELHFICNKEKMIIILHQVIFFAYTRTTFD